MKIKDSMLRRKYIEHLCLTMECSLEDLLRDHRNLLSARLISEAQHMYFEVHGKSFWQNKEEKKP